MLDFGLAKAFASEQSEMVLSDSPTLSVAATQQGVILGTAAYMSPEQAKGKSVDKRADIWAFGAVLFEMLTGKPAFPGDEISEILASVIKADSNLALLPETIHPRIREVLTRCLQKDLRKRYAGIADVRYEIEQVLADPRGVYASIAEMVNYREKYKNNLSWIAAALILTAVVAGLAGWMLRQEPSPQVLQVSKFSHILSNDLIFQRWYTNLAISPDGRNIVYSTNDGLYIRPIDAFQAVPISGSEKDSLNPFFSPDGQWIGFCSPKDWQLKKISINGGSPVILCHIEAEADSNWEENNRILFTGEGGIYQVSGDGGDSELIVPKENDYIVYPQMLPGGKAILFTLLFSNRIAVHSLESGERTILMPGTRARYLPTGHLVYFMENSLYAVRFDPEKLEVIGGQVPIVQGVSALNVNPDFAISKTGTLVYLPGSPLSSLSQLEWYDREGNKLGAIGGLGPYEQFSLSPDETKVVIEKRTSDGYDLWVMELDRGGVEFPLTIEPSNERDPIWTHDGKSIIFNSNKDGPDHIYQRSLTTEEETELYAVPNNRLVAEDCSRDGRYLAYNINQLENRGIWILSLLDDPSPKQIVKGEFLSDEPKFSPDGKWLAYVSNKTGEYEVWLLSLEGERVEHRVSINGGGQPKWKEDQKELYYLAADGSMMAVPLKGKVLTPGEPEFLFKTNLIPMPTIDQYAVTGDGQRFLILNSGDGANNSAFNIVLNWFEELKERVPVE